MTPVSIRGGWLGSWKRDFGWDIGEPGHNFTLANPANWQQAVTGSLLSHMGEHGPMLLLRDGQIEPPVAHYLERVQPQRSAPSAQLTNHGWILGTADTIPRASQIQIDSLLEPK